MFLQCLKTGASCQLLIGVVGSKALRAISSALTPIAADKTRLVHRRPCCRTISTNTRWQQKVKKQEKASITVDEHRFPLETSSNTNRFTVRTNNCGELRAEHVGQPVVLCGWLEYSRMNKFFTLRDGYGAVQAILADNVTGIARLDELSFETILEVTGVVQRRPTGQENRRLSTGDIEVLVSNVRVLNAANSRLPIDVQEFNRAKENLRLEYRYIDLRNRNVQYNLRLRSQVLMKMREFMINRCGFLEVETPTLFRRTPGGAQEFVVPSRKAGHFYSLVQSPQQFKQMLMVGAIDRYFQIARCYRDESTRPDRQPEFTQLDIELSFTDREQVLSLVEQILSHSWPDADHPLEAPFPRMTLAEAINRFGSDKPDTRFGYELQDVTVTLAHKLLPDGMRPQDFGAFAIVVRGPNGQLPTALKKSFDAIAKETKLCRLLYSKMGSSSVSRLLGPEVTQTLSEQFTMQPDDLLLLAWGKRTFAQNMLGRSRLALYESLEARGLVEKRSHYDRHFLWIIDFPMFSENEETLEIESTHHPFTAPHPEDAARLRRGEDILSVRSLSYDLVWNGVEIGGGSIRIHESQLQRMVLERILRIEHTHLQHLLDALDSGCPPHGGFAIGLDRYVALLCNAQSIRDVIAFPKSLDGKDPLSKAPVPISEEEKRIYHIKVVE